MSGHHPPHGYRAPSTGASRSYSSNPSASSPAASRWPPPGGMYRSGIPSNPPTPPASTFAAGPSQPPTNMPPRRDNLSALLNAPPGGMEEHSLSYKVNTPPPLPYGSNARNNQDTLPPLQSPYDSSFGLSRSYQKDGHAKYPNNGAPSPTPPDPYHGVPAAAASIASTAQAIASASAHRSGTDDASPEMDDSMNPPPLRRNQACVSCRKRKLKCDATKPVCGTCKKSREAALQARHPPPVPPGDCVYTDDNPRGRKSKQKAPAEDGDSSNVEGSAKKRKKRKDGPADAETEEEARVGMLENRIKHLESMLMQSMARPHDARPTSAEASRASHPVQLSPSAEWVPLGHSPGGDANPFRRPSSLSSSDPSQLERFRLYHYRSRPRVGFPAESPHSSHSGANQNQSDLFDIDLPTAPIQGQQQPRIVAEPDPILELLFPGYPADLPSPDTVFHLSEIFFSRHPMGVMIYKPSFMASLSLPPRHPDRPDVGLIHAVLGAAAPLSPFFADDPDWQPARHFPELLVPDEEGEKADNLNHAFQGAFDGRTGAQTPSSSGVNANNATRMSFAEFHLTRARIKISRALVTRNANPLDWIQAMVLVADCLWNQSRLLEAFMIGGTIARVMAPCGLMKLQSFKQPNVAEGCYLAPPVTAPEEHERRVTFWCAYMTETVCATQGIYFESLINDAGITTSLPCSIAEFQSGFEPQDNPQNLASEDLFEHGHVDEFSLHIKGVILVKRAKYLLGRNNITSAADKKPPGFRELDAHISQILQSAPPLKDPNQMHLIAGKASALMAIAILHEPWALPYDEASYSYKRVELMVKETLKVLDLLQATSFDASLLHSRVSMLFFVAARMLAGKVEYLRLIGADNTTVDDLLAEYDRIASTLSVMALRSKFAKRASLHMRHFRDGTWNQAQFAEAMTMSDILPTGDDAVY